MGVKILTIPNGYCDICNLNDKLLAFHNLKLQIYSVTSMLSVSDIQEKFNSHKLALTLGLFDSRVVDGVLKAAPPPRLSVHKNLFVYLDEMLSTTDTRNNNLPSTLLSLVPVKTGRCNSDFEPFAVSASRSERPVQCRIYV